MGLNMCNKIGVVLVIIIGVIEIIIFSLYIKEYEGEVDLANTTCTTSVHIGRKIFFHICMKENKSVYDLRYFWKDTDTTHTWKANIIGVQMTSNEFIKLCNFCSSV